MLDEADKTSKTEDKPVNSLDAKSPEEIDRVRMEKKLLKTSFMGCILFIVAEFIMAMVTDSKALLMDCVWDGSDLIMMIPLMMLISLLQRPATEKRPFGFAQVESILVLVKCGMLIFITGMLIVDGVESILHGGNMVNGGLIATFQLVVSAICMSVYLIIRKYAKKISSPTIMAEIYIWKLDSLSTLGVAVGFGIQIVLVHIDTPISWIAPYIDPAIAIIMASVLLREPIKLAWSNLRDLMLFAPEAEIVEDVRSIVDGVLQETDLKDNFLDIVKTGRMLWIGVYFVKEDNQIDINYLRAIRYEIEKKLKAHYNNLYIELIPELDKVSVK